jgi:transposase
MRYNCITISLELPEFDVLWTAEHDGLIEIKVVKRVECAICPECGRLTQHLHDERVDDVWDVPAMGKGIKLLVVKRRWWCCNPNCPQTTPFTEGFDSLDLGQHRTHRLNAHVYRLTKRMSNAEVVRDLAHYQIPMSESTVRRLHRAFAQREVGNRPLRQRRVIGIDEFSIKKRHTYATIITDLINKDIVDTFEKRDKETVVQHLNQLPYKEAIEAAVIDMSRTFRSAIREVLPDCYIVIDKFHVVAVVIDALDEVRKRVQRSRAKGQKKPIYKLRYRLRKGREKLSEEETQQLWSVLLQEPELLLAYLLKETFRDWYKLQNTREAAQQLEYWCAWAEASSLPEMTEAVKTLRNWQEEILNYFIWRYTNAFTEGKNNKIKLIKRQGYGYGNFDNFRLRILTQAA